MVRRRRSETPLNCFRSSYPAGDGRPTLPFITPRSIELVTVELFRSDGSGLLNRVISLGPDETQRFTIEPSAQFSDGWAKLSSEGRFSATLLFQLVDSGGVVSEAGVLPADAVQNLKLVGSVHLDQGLTTGIAIANPSPTKPSVITVLTSALLGSWR